MKQKVDILFETERLLLRRVESADEGLFLSLFCQPEMMNYLGEVWSQETAIEALQEWQREWGINNYYYGVIVRKEDRQAIGIAGITEDTNPEEKGIEFAWFVLPEFQGMGYASEITRAIMNFVFEDLKKERLFGETHPENPASNRVLEKLGFTLKGEYQRSIDYLPEFDRQVIWELTRSDWKRAGN